MNLAVHGLEGDIQKAITYYEDPHELLGKADFVMANPPFNVDEIDADKVKSDPRLPFGLPGVNKKGKVSNGNYIWISYFYSYLNEQGRAGFVMSSQASSAGRDEAKVRQKLVETGDVDVMIAIRSNFFYTRTVPCELWFLNRAKPEAHRDKVLMIDARNIYRKVTRKIYDFQPGAGAEPPGHRLALPGPDRAIPRPGGRLLPAACSTRATAVSPSRMTTARRSSRCRISSHALATLREAIAAVPEDAAPRTRPTPRRSRNWTTPCPLFKADVEAFRESRRRSSRRPGRSRRPPTAS